jgi:hypothetical protein
VCDSLCVFESESEIIIDGADRDDAFALILDLSDFHVFNDGVEVEVHSEGDHEAHPLHGEIPVGEGVLLGDVVGLLETLVGFNGGGGIEPEANNLDDSDNDEADGVDVMHDAGPDDEEPDEGVVVGGGEDPDEGGGNPLDEEGDGVDVLGESPHGVAVHQVEVLLDTVGGSVLGNGSVPEVVVVVLHPVEGGDDGGGSEHNPGSVLLLVPELHTVLVVGILHSSIVVAERSGISTGSSSLEVDKVKDTHDNLYLNYLNENYIFILSKRVFSEDVRSMSTYRN